MPAPISILAVALGSALGGVTRFLVTGLGEWWLGTGSGSILATVAINIVGSFFIGLTYGLTDRQLARHFIGVGILGGFTTFSSFSAQTLFLLQEQPPRVGAALLNVGASVALCLLGCWAGWACAQLLKRPA
jgi:CrcB protein